MLFDPIVEHNIITQWLGQLIGKPITPRKFVHKLSIFLNRRHPVTIHLEVNDNILDVDDFTVGGVYDVVRDEDHLKPLVFFFIINHSTDDPWIIDNSIADELALELIEALVHEYQHLHQYRLRDYMLNRDFKSLAKDPALKENQEYLGQLDEIDAYAANIAVRFYIKKDRYSMDLERYKEAFGCDHWVVRRLLKKITKRLNYLQSLDSHYISTET